MLKSKTHRKVHSMNIPALKNPENVRLSLENTKMGKTVNLNLAPIGVCEKLPCFSEGCYAWKFYRLRPSVNAVWGNNSRLYAQSPYRFFKSLMDCLSRKKNVKFFRWHSSGEIPDQNYVDGMCLVARRFPNIRFLCFTKQYKLSFAGCPKNLRVYFSSWVNYEMPKHVYNTPIAWYQNGEEKRMEGRKSFVCLQIEHKVKMCEKCRRCWNLNAFGDVIFPKH